MAELLKDIYTEAFLTTFSQQVQEVYRPFKAQQFVRAVLADNWADLTLKQRTRQIAIVLGQFLPQDYSEAIALLEQLAPDCQGFAYLFFPDFVVVYGTRPEDWALSMHALEIFTQQSSAEFAIRTFILTDPKRAMGQMTQWAQSANAHVRRLASEGCRPRLPWGESLPVFKQDPIPVLAILERLKNDPELYVRRSVANNLNDIAKDHPQLVIETAKKWQGQSEAVDWVIRHGCRTLLRKDFLAVQTLFGYAADSPAKPLVLSAIIKTTATTVAIGDKLAFHYQIRFRPEAKLLVRVEYAVDYVKANGQQSRKLFKLAEKEIDGRQGLRGERQINFKDLTTRKHYPGQHNVALIVNGREVAKTAFEVVRREE